MTLELGISSGSSSVRLSNMTSLENSHRNIGSNIPETTGGTIGTVPISSGSGYSPYYPYSSGYICPECGMWVYYGSCHACYKPVTVISYPVYVQPAPTDLTPLLEKLDELKKEIKKLKKLAENK